MPSCNARRGELSRTGVSTEVLSFFSLSPRHLNLCLVAKIIDLNSHVSLSLTSLSLSLSLSYFPPGRERLTISPPPSLSLLPLPACCVCLFSRGETPGGRKTARQIKSARATNALFEIAEETVESVTATVSEISDTVSEISDTVSGTIEAVSTDVDTVSEAVATTVATTADSVAQVAAPVSDVAAQSGGGLPEGAALIAGGAVVVLGGIGGLLALLLKPSARAVSAAQALDILAETSKAKLVDLRPKADVNAIGSPGEWSDTAIC